MPEDRTVRVLVVDDSALIRKLLGEILSQAPGIEVVGTATDPYDAREKIKQLAPDVLTLDVEMPKMDGITFLRNLMRLRPMPVVMVSSLTEAGAEVTLEALEVGAVDFVTKPKVDVSHAFQGYADELARKVRTAAGVRLQTRSARATVDPQRLAPVSKRLKTTDRVITLGASTGGTEALREVLVALPPDAPGILITQHIPAGFSRAFAERMDRSTALTVKEAEDGDIVVPGHAYIAPGTDYHLRLARDGARYVCRLDQNAPVNRHRPSVDVLFNSAAEQAGANVVAALLTGMGDDGARGLRALRDAGAHTIAQDEKTSLVWGMPGAAVKRGAAVQVLPLAGIASALIQDHRNPAAASE
ncbi:MULTISPECIES: chemotaxis response regulator protein-glutamate methylesterase [unclassified Thioalkalivibrio]|uniref:protein-glutamate methylesterase/protein-glutamine glutaminase n=1 Tax=unclassified Thioalkalivibrio TaxID=2621013 RepID=UPI00037618F3|nr:MULTISPECIES: chemotaxis response regulator protein-glutamate methylesterase [unclassified Thioalkalivibrio]